MNKKQFWSWQDTVIVILGLAAILFAVVNYNRLPDQLPMHFDIHGNVDRYGGKLNAIGFLACLGLFLPIALGVARHIDPRKGNYDMFQNAFGIFRIALAVFLDLMLVAIVLYGLGHKINMTNSVMVGIGLLFLVMGNYMPQIKDNFFIGIRTPWTLSDPEVWRKTHRLGGRLWVLAGLLVAIGALLPTDWMPAVILIALIPLAVIPLFYSWWISRKAD
ncbi:SdpI family protein [Gorillibacterium sp. sgz500922]|uniref:SdpI family protein n=1 Tax=Gorillibacterium sp. sgz500922 TaxID=3446694 RepID=UPI003F66645C